MPNYTYFCDSCELITDGHYKLSETRPELIPCSECGQDAVYTFAAPMVLRASYPDGMKRKGFQQLREGAKLVKQIAAADTQEQKAELRKELKKTKVAFGQKKE